MAGAGKSFKAKQAGFRMGASAARMLVAAFVLWTAPARAQTNPLHRALDAYALYQEDVTVLLDAEIDGPEALGRALEHAARHDPRSVARGFIAYGALTAAQSPAYVRGVQSRVRAAGRAAVLRQLRRDLAYARRRPPGTAEATQLVLAAAAADGARLTAAGHRYDGLGRTLDAGAWTIDVDRSARDAHLRASNGAARAISLDVSRRLHVGVLAASPLDDADAFGGSRFWDALAGRASPAPPALPWRLRSERASSLDRMFTLAALLIVGATGTETMRVGFALEDARTRDCLALEQLQFRQCASVAHDADEDALCLARHGLAGPGACFGALAQ